jgi:hypothetical protein
MQISTSHEYEQAILYNQRLLPRPPVAIPVVREAEDVEAVPSPPRAQFFRSGLVQGNVSTPALFPSPFCKEPRKGFTPYSLSLRQRKDEAIFTKALRRTFEDGGRPNG